MTALYRSRCNPYGIVKRNVYSKGIRLFMLYVAQKIAFNKKGNGLTVIFI